MYGYNLVFALTFLSCAHISLAKDPAGNWWAYAAGTHSGSTRITYLEAYWNVASNPNDPSGRFTTWIGIAPADGMNLIQPVTLWKDTWQSFNEYFQWSPGYNADFLPTGYPQAGDLIYANITYVPGDTPSYDMYMANLNSNWSQTANVPVQMANNGFYKNYTVIYVTTETPTVTSTCNQWPPNNGVVFRNIVVKYDDVVVSPSWAASNVRTGCASIATIINSTTVKLSWNSAQPAPTPSPCAGSISISQTLSNSWTDEDGVLWTQWVVTVQTGSLPIYSLTLKVLPPTEGSDISNYWGITQLSGDDNYAINDWRLDAGYVVPAGTPFDSIGYEIDSDSPASVIVGSVSCTQPTVNCAIVVTQNAVSNWTSNGHLFVQYFLNLTNTGTWPAASVNVLTSLPSGAIVPQYWNLVYTGPMTPIANWNAPLWGIRGGQTSISSGFIVQMASTTLGTVRTVLRTSVCQFSP